MDDDRSFTDEELPQHPRYDPTHFLIRLHVNRNGKDFGLAGIGTAGRLAWASGDLDAAQAAGRCTIVERPLLEGADAERFIARRDEQRRRDRLAFESTPLIADGDDQSPDDWIASKGLGGLLIPKRNLF